MGQMHPEITDTEYALVARRMAPPKEVIKLPSGEEVTITNETPDEWFARNVAEQGEETAVVWFKMKADRQRTVEINAG